MNSFSLLRTHTGLTTNVKIMVDSQYNLYLESIDSDPKLSSSNFKHFQFNKDQYYDELVPYFYSQNGPNLPSGQSLGVDIAFSVFYNSDNDNMSNDFSNQYDDMYVMGARNIIDNKNYSEEYEYFAPLYIFKHKIPKYFIIFRIDGPGLIDLSSSNFRSEFLTQLKTVKLIDLTKNTVLGEWIDNNFTKNINFPISGLNVDFRELEFSNWIGIDYETGGYTKVPFYLEDNLSKENTLFDLESLFVTGYANNKVIFPHILNFSFLFDDTPATPKDLRDWSLNRYSGFYLDNIDQIDAITPFRMQQLQPDVVVTSGNVISSVIGNGDPFKYGFQSNSTNFVEYLGNFYTVQSFTQTQQYESIIPVNIGGSTIILNDEIVYPTFTMYKIMSDIDLSGKQSILNTRHCYINDLNQLLLVDSNAPYQIDGFSLADVNIINIDGTYHNLVLQVGSYSGGTASFITVVSDYGFSYKDSSQFNYFINSGLPGTQSNGLSYSNSIDLSISQNNQPISFPIYRLCFTDVKDFDTCVVDNDFSKFEYEKANSLTTTEETKMYYTDLRSKSNPPSFDDFTFQGKTQFIPVSSDYTANMETFRISTIDNTLGGLWRKNPISCRWGVQNSISAHDRPYLLNNNLVHEKFNRTVDTQNSSPDRNGRNLDYFYTFNSGTTSYLDHSLHLEKNYGDIQDSSYHFELDKYLGTYTYSINSLTYSYDFDYFSLIFSSTQSFLDGNIIENKTKFSYFDAGDQSVPNITVFRGLKFKIFDVEGINSSDSISIDNLNLSSNSNFQDYKFSVLLSSNDWMVANDGSLYKPYEWDYFNSISGLSSSLAIFGSDITSELVLGDPIEIDGNYPNTIYGYQATASYVYGLSPSGFITDKSYTGSQYSQSGIWRSKMQWQVIKEWQIDRTYQIGDLVIWEEIVYQSGTISTITDPTLNPSNSSDYSLFNILLINTPYYASDGPFWNPLVSFAVSSWVYIYGEYYLRNSSGVVDFYDPSAVYATGSIVNYQNIYFQASATNVGIRPIVQTKSSQMSSGSSYWIKIPSPAPSTMKWSLIQLWDQNRSSYPSLFYIIYNDTLYYSISPMTFNDVPGVSPNWFRMYSFVPDPTFIYNSSVNPVIKIGEYFYYCKWNPGQIVGGGITAYGNLTLDDGITIYINKKWKNVLVNIAVNDNTMQTNNLIVDDTRNQERDNLYVETNARFTAANIIKSINDLDTLYGFVNYTSYVVIEEDGTFAKYNFKNNISKLPHLLIVEEADNFNIIDNTLIYNAETIDSSILKSSRPLVNGLVDNLQKINYYNLLPLSVDIENNTANPKVLPNLNNQKNIITNSMYRFSGNYMPMFYDVQLFQSYYVDIIPDTSISGTISYNLHGNYIFDTGLTLFGVMRQRVMSKINPTSNILKLRNNKSYNSIYPMLDEFGYTFADFFIFKSTWDFEYHLMVNSPDLSIHNIYQTLYIDNIVQQYNI